MGNGRGGGAGAERAPARTRPISRRQGVIGGLCLWESFLSFCGFFAFLRLGDAVPNVVRQALAQLFFFRVSFAFLLYFFLSSFLSFVLSFWAFLFRSFSRAATRARRTSRLRRGRVVRLEFSRFSCAPAGRCSLFPLSFLAPFLVSFLLCLFLFFALRLPRRRAGWLRSRQDSFYRGPSLGLFLFLKALFLRLFFGPLCGFCSLHGGALTVCCFFFLCVSSGKTSASGQDVESHLIFRAWSNSARSGAIALKGFRCPRFTESVSAPIISSSGSLVLTTMSNKR